MKGRLQGGGTRSASLLRWFGSVRKRGEMVGEEIGRERELEDKETQGKRRRERQKAN